MQVPGGAVLVDQGPPEARAAAEPVPGIDDPRAVLLAERGRVDEGRALEGIYVAV